MFGLTETSLGFFGALVVVLVAIGAAFLLKNFMPHVAWKRRALIAGLIAGFLPMLVPAILVLGRVGSMSKGVWPLAIMALCCLLLTLVVGFPAAYIASRSWYRASLNEQKSSGRA